MERNEGIIHRARVKSVAKAIPAAAGPPRLIFSLLRERGYARGLSLSLSLSLPVYRRLDPPVRDFVYLTRSDNRESLTENPYCPYVPLHEA